MQNMITFDAKLNLDCPRRERKFFNRVFKVSRVSFLLTGATGVG